MTTPEERTKAVAETRQFLETLLGAEEEIMWGLVRTVSRQVLRHYPQNCDLEASASALPDVWASPKDVK